MKGSGMAKGHPDLPSVIPVQLSKGALLSALLEIDQDAASRQRVLDIETEFRKRIVNHVSKLPAAKSKFEKFSTSPFVLMIYSQRNGYSRISEIEGDILPAKLFSSMETSAGRMIEEIVLPIYGWECVPSEMHTPNSSLDGKKLEQSLLRVATLKSGPRCLNDEMSENFADAIVRYASSWAKEAKVKEIDFTYGVLYGTNKRSNKKDWHILRKLSEKLKNKNFAVSPKKRLNCEFTLDGIKVMATIRVGKAWWEFLGGKNCLVEVCAAIIRACVTPGEMDEVGQKYTISDLAKIVDMSKVPAAYNSALLQRSQIPWLFFLAYHFSDSLTD